jgi:hypothetical protein
MGEPGHRDRTTRLRLFGVLTILAGVAALGLALFNLALPTLTRELLDIPTTTRQVLTGLLTFAAIGVVLVLCGVGSMRRRRWARPAMLTVGWTWLFVGLATVGFMVTNLDDLALLAGAENASQPPQIDALIRWMLLLPSFGFGLVAPVAILWAYAPLDVLHTCRAWHPQPDWSDDCPSTVLILALALGFSGLLSIPLALKPVLPWFGGLLTGGAAGAAVTLATGGTFLWIGWALFRLRPAGWWATGVSAGVFAVSTVWTLLQTPRVEWYRALEYPQKHIDQILAAGEPSPWPAVGATVALTLATAVYLAAIRKHFRG